MHSVYFMLLSELGWVVLRFLLSLVTHLAGGYFLSSFILLLRILPLTVTGSFLPPRAPTCVAKCLASPMLYPSADALVSSLSSLYPVIR